jgi:hypothetical protein
VLPVPRRQRHSGRVRKHQTSDAQLRIGESLDSGFDAEPVVGPAKGRTRWHRPGMTAWMDLLSLSDDVSRHFSRNARIS